MMLLARVRSRLRTACVIPLMFNLFAATPNLAQTARGPEPSDWFAGDPHMHRGICCDRSDAKDMLTPEELLEGMKINNLAVMSVLGTIGDGECKFVEKDISSINGKDAPGSSAQRLLHWDAEWYYYFDDGTTDKEVLGGHVILLGLKEGARPSVEYTYPVFEWGKKQGAIAGYAHMQYLPYAAYAPPDGIPQSLDCCAPLEFPVETALGTSSFLEEDVHGSDSAIYAYYRILNSGFRPGLAAATDYPCNSLEPYGTLLTYVQIPDGKLTYRKWIEGLAKGRTVVSRSGHNEFLDLKVDTTAQPGDEIRLQGKGSVRVRIEWRSLKKAVGRIELVRDGSVVAAQTATAAPGAPAVFETTVDFRKSGWLAARRMHWQNGHQSHTGAVFVIVDSKPIRASASDAEFFVQWIDNLLQKTSPGGPWSKYLSHDREAAQDRYRAARAIFERIASEARERGD